MSIMCMKVERNQKKKAIKDRINRDIKILFEQEEDYYKSVRVGTTIKLNMKVMVIEIKPYQMKNILKK